MSDAIKNYRNNVFCLLYREKKNLLSLYNAVNGSAYEDEDSLEIITLESAICLRMKNDAAFIIDTRLNLYEQQSTVNPNMPLRDLYYVAEELKRIVPPGRLYGRKKTGIPAPRFVTFYNGTEEQPERQMYRLSDLYVSEEKGEPELELKVTVLNINGGCNKDILEKCESLKGYMDFVRKVREKKDSGMEPEKALTQAVEECISEDILAAFFQEHKKEIIEMSIFEFDEELYEKVIREESKEEGREEGLTQINLLIKHLCDDGRMDDLVRSSQDQEFQEKLLKEYGLCRVNSALQSTAN